jgi:hypothetical protein
MLQNLFSFLEEGFIKYLFFVVTQNWDTVLQNTGHNFFSGDTQDTPFNKKTEPDLYYTNNREIFTAKHYRSSKRMKSSSGEWFLVEPSIVATIEECHIRQRGAVCPAICRESDGTIANVK